LQLKVDLFAQGATVSHLEPFPDHDSDIDDACVEPVDVDLEEDRQSQEG
jgi:hypothetical protein